MIHVLTADDVAWIRGRFTYDPKAGVRWHKRDKRWFATIGFNGRNVYLGDFAHENDAARAYNEAAKRYFGEFAVLNEVNG